MGYILLSKEISDEELSKFNDNHIIHLSQLNINSVDTLQLERVIPLTSIENLIGFPFIRDQDNPLTTSERSEYNRLYREKYDYLEKMIIAAYDAIKSQIKKFIKLGIITDVYIYVPFVRYLISKNHPSFSFFFVTKFDDSSIFFNVIESMFVIEDNDFSTDAFLKMVTKLFLERRTSTFVLSKDLYKYGEDVKDERGVVFNKNYILRDFIQQNYMIDIMVDDQPEYLTLGMLGKLSDLESEEKTQINYLSSMTVILRNPKFDWNSDEVYMKKLCSLIINEFILRICTKKYFERLESKDPNTLTLLSLEEYCFILKKYLFCSYRRGISIHAKTQIQRHYQNIKLQSRIKWFYLIGGLMNGYISSNN